MAIELSSPTLARLYLQQGHDDRARRMLESIVASDAERGDALALLRRMAIAEGAAFKVKRSASRVDFRWRVVDPDVRDAGFEIRVRTWTGHIDGAQSASFNRIHCDGPRGSHALPLPSRAGALVACLVAIEGRARAHDGDPSDESDAGTDGPDGRDVSLDADLEEETPQIERILAVSPVLTWTQDPA